MHVVVRGGGSVALAEVFCSTRCAGGKHTAKMAGCGNDAQMADAAGAAGSGANVAAGPAGRAGSEARVGSGTRRDGSSADHGRDMMRGGDHAADYPDEAEDQWAGLLLIEGAGPSPIWRTYFSPLSLGTRDGAPVMRDDDLMDAATNNRRVALVRIEKGH